MSLIQEIDETPHFTRQALVSPNGRASDEIAVEALWDVVFVRLSAIQEYGWHAGLEKLMWASDAVNGSLVDLNWPVLQQELQNLRHEWIHDVITHARAHGAFFPKADSDEQDESGD